MTSCATYKKSKRLTLRYFLIGLITVTLALMGLQYLRPQCPPGAVVTVGCGGDLGNRIWEYMSLYSIACFHPNTFPYIDPVIKNSIEDIFESISLPTTEDISTSCYTTRHTYQVGLNQTIDYSKLTEDYHVDLEVYSARSSDIIRCGIDRMQQELRFKEAHVNNARTTLENLAKSFNFSASNTTFVGVHFRGTDYHSFLKTYYFNYTLQFPNYSYYNKAMWHFYSRYENVIFIFITIDQVWLEHTIPYLNATYNVVLNPNGDDRIKDLTLMSLCNHSIISYGTFASTAALFANGQTFVYDLRVPVDGRGSTLAMSLANLLPNWYQMSN